MPSFITEEVADNVGLSFSILLVMFLCRAAAEWAVSRKADRLAARRRRFTVRAVANLLVAFSLLAAEAPPAPARPNEARRLGRPQLRSNAA